MDLVCPGCSTPSRARTSRCEACGATLAPELEREQERWHTVLDGELLGPLARDELVAALRAHPGSAEVPVWREGRESWAPAREIPELVAAMRASAGRAPSGTAVLPRRARAASAQAAAVGGSETSGRIDLSALLESARRMELPSAPSHSAHRATERARSSVAVSIPVPPPLPLDPQRVMSRAARAGAERTSAAVSEAFPAPARPARRARGEVFAAGALLGGCFVAAMAIAPSLVPMVLGAERGTIEPPVSGTPQPRGAVERVLVEVEEVELEGPDPGVEPVAEHVPEQGAEQVAEPPEPRSDVAPVPVAREPIALQVAGSRESAAEASERRVPIAAEPARQGADEVVVRASEPESVVLVGVAEEGRPEAEAEAAAVASGEATTASERADVAESTPPPAPTAPAEVVSAEAGGPSLDSLIAAAVGTPEASEQAPERAAPAPAPSPELSDTPSRDDVDRALARIHSTVAACGEIGHGTATVRITAAGASGRITSAVVEGALAGTPAGSCVARAVRSASFPRFERETFTVVYPFRI